MADRGGQLLPAHQKAPVVGDGQHGAVGVGELGGDHRRHAVAERAADRRELGAERREPPDATAPRRRLAGARGEDGVLRQALAQVGQRAAEARVPGRAHRRVAGPGGPRPRGPARRVGRRQRERRPGDLGAARIERERGREHPAELGRIGVHVHERLARLRRPDEAVARGRGLVEPRPRRPRAGRRRRGTARRTRPAAGQQAGPRWTRRGGASGCRRGPGSRTRPPRAAASARTGPGRRRPCGRTSRRRRRSPGGVRPPRPGPAGGPARPARDPGARCGTARRRRRPPRRTGRPPAARARRDPAARTWPPDRPGR